MSLEVLPRSLLCCYAASQVLLQQGNHAALHSWGPIDPSSPRREEQVTVAWWIVIAERSRVVHRSKGEVVMGNRGWQQSLHVSS